VHHNQLVAQGVVGTISVMQAGYPKVQSYECISEMVEMFGVDVPDQAPSL
jgi:hypothetical protein